MPVIIEQQLGRTADLRILVVLCYHCTSRYRKGSNHSADQQQMPRRHFILCSSLKNKASSITTHDCSMNALTYEQASLKRTHSFGRILTLTGPIISKR